MTFERNDRRDLILAILVSLAAGLALFGWMFGFDLVLADAQPWASPRGDMTVMTTGYEALLREPWRLPLTETSRLGAGAVSIIYTDSIPWISLTLKASGLGPLFNPLGVFLLLCYLLQGPSMILVLRAMGVRKAGPLLAGALLALMTPAWITRQFGHISLCGHFILLLGLALSVDIARHGLSIRRAAAFAALAGFATGIHAYHLPPLGLLLGAALVSILLQRGWRALPGVLGAGAAAVAVIGLCAVLLGYGVGGGANSQGASALGFYSMNLLGPFEPQGSGLVGQTWTGEWFKGAYDPTGGQAFEGYNYLGAGVLFILVVALSLVIVDVSRKRWPSRTQVLRFAPLALAGLALTAAAIGPIVYAHDQLILRLTLKPSRFMDLLALFRSHGRFFWTAGYLLTATSLALVATRLPRVPLLAVLLAAVTLQAIDTFPPRQGVSFNFHHPMPATFPKAWRDDPRLKGRPWAFNPTFWCLTDRHAFPTFDQFALLAVRSGGEVNSVYTARETGARECGYPAELLKDARPGDRRITVVIDQASDVAGYRMAAFAARSDCHRYRTTVICGRDLDLPDATPLAPGDLRRPSSVLTEVRFDKPGQSQILAEGWSELDPGGQGVWSKARTAVLILPPAAPAAVGHRLGLDLTLLSYGEGAGQVQRVNVRIGGEIIQRLQVESALFTIHRLVVPAKFVRTGQPIRLELDLPDARRPPGGDTRLLGVAIQQLKVAY